MHEAEFPYIYKENANIYLEALAELIGTRYGNVTVNLMITGGSAIILRHGFRASSDDIDSYIDSAIDITQEILDVAYMYGITTDWLNDDVVQSPSFSPRLLRNAIPYKSYCNGILNVWTVCDLDLICMKLVAFRDKDIPDLVNLFRLNQCITQNDLITRLQYLYDVQDISSKVSYEARMLVNSLRLPEY